ncbi:MAG: GntR family transcriptional regulator, partial [Anaerolineae bacterium]|nr:GntR family transcriptional regulator [Anaerolineae bacterium]
VCISLGVGMPAINRDGPIPLYRQLYDLLRQQIDAGVLKAGDPLPTEEQLTETYGISRVTTRKALQLLADEGMLIRHPGKGTYINAQKTEENLQSLRGFAELMIEQHPSQIMEIKGFEIIPAPIAVAQLLNLSREDRILRIRRRHVIHGRPVALAIIDLPYMLGSLLTPNDVATRTIYDLLANKAHVSIKRAVQRISATAASQDVSAVLGVEIGAPLLLVRRVTYSMDEQPVEYIQLYYPGDQHEMVMELYR